MKEINSAQYYKEDSWQKFVESIKQDVWPKVKKNSLNIEFDIPMQDDFRIVLLCLFKEKANFWLNDSIPVLGDNTPKDLLTGNCSDVHSVEEGERWVKVALMRGSHQQYYL